MGLLVLIVLLFGPFVLGLHLVLGMPLLWALFLAWMTPIVVLAAIGLVDEVRMAIRRRRNRRRAAERRKRWKEIG